MNIDRRREAREKIMKLIDKANQGETKPLRMDPTSHLEGTLQGVMTGELIRNNFDSLVRNTDLFEEFLQLLE